MLLFGILLSTVLTLSAQQYSLVHLGFSGTARINNLGRVAGYDPLTNTPFLYSGGVVKSLGLGYSYAAGINNSGQIVMYSQTAYHSYIASSPYVVLTDLGTLGGSGGLHGGGVAAAAGMNDSGAVVGQSNAPSGYSHAFLYSSGHMTDLGTLGGNSIAFAINNLGQVVGGSNTLSGFSRAFVMANGLMTDLDPNYQNYDSYATSINNAGQFVVNSDEAYCTFRSPSGKIFQSPCRGSSYHALLYSNGTITNLGSLGPYDTLAAKINRNGDIVGTSYAAQSVQHAFLYHAGVISDLNNHKIVNATGWTFQIAYDMNDSGQIVCLGYTAPGQYETVILTPVPTHVLSLTISPSAVAGGSSAFATVTLDGPAPVGGATVYLSSNNSAAHVPPSVTIPENFTSTGFTITTSPIFPSMSATITATYAGSVSANLFINDPGS
jgi:probable HAF family extracellular repeat protein